jgi:hypothetical protein
MIVPLFIFIQKLKSRNFTKIQNLINKIAKKKNSVKDFIQLIIRNEEILKGKKQMANVLLGMPYKISSQ